MPHVSKVKIDKKTEKQINETFRLVLTNIKNEREMDNFLNSLLSPTENLMLSKRLAIVLLLSENLPASKIASTLHVTRETVARIELIFKLKSEGYNTALIKIQNEKIVKELKGALLKLAGYTVRAATGYIKPEIS